MDYKKVISRRRVLKEILHERLQTIWEIGRVMESAEPYLEPVAKAMCDDIDLEVGHLCEKIARFDFYVEGCYKDEDKMQSVAPYIFDCSIEMIEVPF